MGLVAAAGALRAVRAMMLLATVMAHAVASSTTPTATPSPSVSVAPSRTLALRYKCGDGMCDATYLRVGETCGNCPEDCGPCQIVPDAATCVVPGEYSLSFDDGPSVFTHNLLDSLSALKVNASFFLIGTNMKWMGAITQRQVSVGHSTLSHTFTHPHFLQTSIPDTYYELVKNDVAFSVHSCRRPTIYRPPYGETDDVHRALAHRMGYRGVVWNLDTQDWNYAKSHPDWILGNFSINLAAKKNGSIIQLQHDLLQESIDLVPQLVGMIRDAGYTFVSTERCIWGDDYESHPSWAYMLRNCNDASVKGAGVDPRFSWPKSTAANPCPLTTWSEWSGCDAVCGAGSQTRVRLTMPPSLRSKSQCRGVELIQQRPCTGNGSTPSGPVNCSAPVSSSCSTLTEWSWWNATVECGLPVGLRGTQLQYRRVLRAGESRSSAAKLPGSNLTAADITALEAVPEQCGPVLRAVLCAGTGVLPPSSVTFSDIPTPTGPGGTTVTSTSGTTTIAAKVGLSLVGAIVAVVVIVAYYLKKRLGDFVTSDPPKKHTDHVGGHGDAAGAAAGPLAGKDGPASPAAASSKSSATARTVSSKGSSSRKTDSPKQTIDLKVDGGGQGSPGAAQRGSMRLESTRMSKSVSSKRNSSRQQAQDPAAADRRSIPRPASQRSLLPTAPAPTLERQSSSRRSKPTSPRAGGEDGWDALIEEGLAEALMLQDSLRAESPRSQRRSRRHDRRSPRHKMNPRDDDRDGGLSSQSSSMKDQNAAGAKVVVDLDQLTYVKNLDDPDAAIAGMTSPRPSSPRAPIAPVAPQHLLMSTPRLPVSSRQYVAVDMVGGATLSRSKSFFHRNNEDGADGWEEMMASPKLGDGMRRVATSPRSLRQPDAPAVVMMVTPRVNDSGMAPMMMSPQLSQRGPTGAALMSLRPVSVSPRAARSVDPMKPSTATPRVLPGQQQSFNWH